MTFLGVLSDVKQVKSHCYKPNYFRCLEGRYIPADRLCDDYYDCNYDEDEDKENCGTELIYLEVNSSEIEIVTSMCYQHLFIVCIKDYTKITEYVSV